MYMLPVTARFLTDVSLKVNFGEIHGIIGASGSGKSTLLQVISHRVDGKVTGDIKLNGELLTESNFTKLCKFVNFNIDLLPYLSVEQTIKYHAQICLSCTVAVLGQRISMLMQKFDLLSYVHRRVDQLTPSARYRLIMVLNLLGDPLLVLLDDPLTKLDALSNYQLMSSLREYVKENSRMALVTMRYPRSDIYQLIDGLTLLFYGEIVYSGPTKFMPHYFSQIGYKCPITENPAVYYLSLATVDRENPESYAETQEKATELVETFKKRRDNFDFSSYQPKTPSDSPILSNYYGQPSFFKHLYLLSLRNINLMLRSWPFMMTQTLYFAIFLFVAIFGGHFYTTTKHTPLSASGTLFSLVYFTAVVTVFATVINSGISSILSSGFLKSYQSFNSINEGLLYLSSLCPERFANFLLDYEFVNSTKSITCHRNEQIPFPNETDFCRWKTGNDYLTEMLAEPMGPPEQWQGLLIVGIALLFSLATYFVVTPKKAISFAVQ
ncbi:unnamed protein product [Bursaphelenchus xylophilus]|uniref:(pine wood nematode) hypothetical protein n=1 Tax=Bursaphelenchus xylophilus TaxID=6326 RepID=A0A7I8WQX2_BURXY|nr:unnamed protein product [Bursaphelenchus xylophilus]CAG9096924.1 unnamed protein product [Bursaphelenchus xylophilus]